MPPTKFAERGRLAGLGVSAGVAHGPVAHMPDSVSEPLPVPALPTAEREPEVERVQEAARRVHGTLLARARTVEGPAGSVLSATAAMALDPMLWERTADRIRHQGASAASAVWHASAEIGSLLSGAGELMAARVRDLHDVRDRLVCVLEGRPAPEVPERDDPFVLVATDLAPADTATLDSSEVLALVTEEGGPTSHTAILARALGIPAVVGVRGATRLAEDVLVIVDGTAGTLEVAPGDVGPDPAAIPGVRETPDFDGTGTTADGHRVPLMANVGDPAGAQAAFEAHAEGVGLFRTEFCFLGRATAPSVAEQVQVYREVFERFPGRRVVTRTLDAGSDKPLPFLTCPDEPNPALGVRGYRTTATSPEVLEDQLDALAEAARGSEADVWVMAPMISTPAEADEFVTRAGKRGLHTAGIMIEVPAIALQAEQAMTVCDFVSLGTNDLSQYLMAADRQLGGEVASLNDPWQPALLHLIAHTCAAGRAGATPVSVCGEAAADPYLACVLVGLGVTSLSMTPRAIPAVAAQLAAVTLPDCERAAQRALRAATAQQARETVHRGFAAETLNTP